MKPNYKHGLYKSSAYRRWIYMKMRCNKDAHYLKLGINVCDRWLTSFINFYADMGEPPKGMTLDRIDGTKGYSPDNCRWATYKEQNNNLSNNVYIKGKRLVDVVNETGLHRNTVQYRISKGIPLTEKLLGQRDTCKKGHIMDEANTYGYKGKRFCRKCRAEYQAYRRKQLGEG